MQDIPTPSAIQNHIYIICMLEIRITISIRLECEHSTLFANKASTQRR